MLSRQPRRQIQVWKQPYDTRINMILATCTAWRRHVTSLSQACHLKVHFWCQLRIASARPILGPSGPCAHACARVVVQMYMYML